jgi:exonuclease SbcD
VSQLAKPRIPELSASSSIDPMSALKTYLNNREDLQEIMPSMLEAAHNLLADDEGILLVPQGGIKN